MSVKYIIILKSYAYPKFTFQGYITTCSILLSPETIFDAYNSDMRYWIQVIRRLTEIKIEDFLLHSNIKDTFYSSALYNHRSHNFNAEINF